MRLAVLDTNVIVSAGIKPGGAPAELIMDWVLEGQIQVVTSPWVVGEYRGSPPGKVSPLRISSKLAGVPD